MRKPAKVFAILIATSILLALASCSAKKETMPTTSTAEQAEEERPAAPQTIADANRWLDEGGSFKVCEFFQSYGWSAHVEGYAYVAEQGDTHIVLRTAYRPEWWVKDSRLDNGGLIFVVSCDERATDFATIHLDNGNDVAEELLALIQDYLTDPEGAECRSKNDKGRFYDYMYYGATNAVDIDVYDCSEQRYAESAQHEQDEAASADYAEIVASVDENRWSNGDRSFDVSKLLSHYGWTMEYERERGDEFYYERPFAVVDGISGFYGEMIMSVEDGYVSFEVYRYGLCLVGARYRADEARLDGARLVALPEFVRLLEEVLCAAERYPESSHEIFLGHMEEYRSGETIEYRYESHLP